MTNC